MPGVAVTVVVDTATPQLQRMARVYPKALRRAMDHVANDARTIAMVSMARGRPAGRVYPFGTSGRTHRASAPGQPPAVRTGALLNSIAWRRRYPAWEVYTPRAYGAPLEFGTRKMAARPWLIPATQKAVKGFPKAFAAEIRRG